MGGPVVSTSPFEDRMFYLVQTATRSTFSPVAVEAGSDLRVHCFFHAHKFWQDIYDAVPMQ